MFALGPVPATPQPAASLPQVPAPQRARLVIVVYLPRPVQSSPPPTMRLSTGFPAVAPNPISLLMQDTKARPVRGKGGGKVWTATSPEGGETHTHPPFGQVSLQPLQRRGLFPRPPQRDEPIGWPGKQLAAWGCPPRRMAGNSNVVPCLSYEGGRGVSPLWLVLATGMACLTATQKHTRPNNRLGVVWCGEL